LSKLGKAMLLPLLSAGTVTTTAAAVVAGGVATTGGSVGSLTAVTEGKVDDVVKGSDTFAASGDAGGGGGVAMTGVMVVRRSWSTETALVTASTSIRRNITLLDETR
jgi:hypothetical protein